MANEFAFLPWMKSPLSMRAEAPASGVRAVVPVGVQVTANGADQGAAARTPIELLGAGDIASIERPMITWVEPRPGSRGIEPNYFPYVEFADADFPWRYSLDVSRGNRARPWLALVALKADEFRFVPRVGNGLPSIEVTSPGSSLPDLAQSWAAAHVQVDLTAPGASLATLPDVVRRDPGAHFSRLLCLRKLAGETAYFLFLVPAFEAGRLKGLDRAEAATPWDAPAWSSATAGPIQLPYYAEWSFGTAATEDFESLVRRLTPRDLDVVGGGLTARRVRGGEPGHFPGYLDAQATFVPEGALRTPRADDVRAGFAGDALTPRLAGELTAAIAPLSSLSGPDSAVSNDPLFTLPAYGHLFRRSAAIRAPGAGAAWPNPDPWIHEANLDRRYRLAAGIGARVVRRHQEALMSAAWSQAGEIVAANRLVALAHAARRLQDRLHTRYVASIEPDIVLALAEPMLPALRYPATSATMEVHLRRLGLPSGALSVTERKVLAKRPMRAETALRGAQRTTARGPARARVPDTHYGASLEVRPAAAESRQVRAKWTSAVFPKTDQVTLKRVLRSPALRMGTVFAQRELEVDGLRDSVVEQMARVPELRVARQLTGLTAREVTELEPALRGPRIPEPMFPYLLEQGADFLLPGLANLPDETVGVLLENPRYIEAFLLGANHEMNRELLWREYPGDLRSTVFARFWERGAPPDDHQLDDIVPIDQWTGALGTHARDGGGEDLVLVVRGELVRRFPGFQVALNRQRLVGGEWRPDAGQTMSPRFWAAFGPDSKLFGFPLTEAELRAHKREYFFVIYEPAGRYRFGLDVATDAVRRARRDLRRAALPFPMASLAASTARIALSASPGTGASSPIAVAPTAPATPVPASWADLSWDHVQLTSSQYVDAVSEVHPTAGDAGQWGSAAHSAGLASVMFQRPMRVVIGAGRMVGDG